MGSRSYPVCQWERSLTLCTSCQLLFLLGAEGAKCWGVSNAASLTFKAASVVVKAAPIPLLALVSLASESPATASTPFLFSTAGSSTSTKEDGGEEQTCHRRPHEAEVVFSETCSIAIRFESITPLHIRRAIVEKPRSAFDSRPGDQGQVSRVHWLVRTS